MIRQFYRSERLHRRIVDSVSENTEAQHDTHHPCTCSRRGAGDRARAEQHRDVRNDEADAERADIRQHAERRRPSFRRPRARARRACRSARARSPATTRSGSSATSKRPRVRRNEKGPAMRGLFVRSRRLRQLASQSRFGAGGVNASQIAYGRTIQNRNGMTHLAVARHQFGREENAGGKRWFRCAGRESAQRQCHDVRGGNDGRAFSIATHALDPLSFDPRGRSSVVERQLPKLNVVGSIPIARSNLFLRLVTKTKPAGLRAAGFAGPSPEKRYDIIPSTGIAGASAIGR